MVCKVALTSESCYGTRSNDRPRAERSLQSLTQQLTLFPDQVRLTKVVPEENQHRFYLMRTLPDLFGSCGLLREWGRMGSPGRMRLDWHVDEGAAVNALTNLCRQKQRRGYHVA